MMTDRVPVHLTPSIVALGSDEYKAISAWPYSDAFVPRLLTDDIPYGLVFSQCRMWVYKDPAGQIVGFGTLDLCRVHDTFTSGQLHTYIPLLAVNPSMQGKGYGTSILRHLTDEAAIAATQSSVCHDMLFLDVYTSSEPAIKMYEKSGFVVVSPSPILDELEGGKPYIIMARRVSVASA